MFKSILGALLLLGPVWVVACSNDDEQPPVTGQAGEGSVGGESSVGGVGGAPETSEAGEGGGGTRMQVPLGPDGCPDWDFWEDVNGWPCNDEDVKCSFAFICGIGKAATPVDTLSCEDGRWVRGSESAPCTCPTDLPAADGTSCRGFEPGYACFSGQDQCDEPERRCSEEGVWQPDEPLDCGGAGGTAAGGAGGGGAGGAP